MTDVDQRIHQYADEVYESVVRWRRDFHLHPELGNQEVRTSQIVAEHLRAIGVDEVYEHLAGGTGVLGVIHGAQPGPTVGLRADMDALPIREDTGLPFASTDTTQWGNQGTVPVMHACGHDMHTAMLMGAAQVYMKHRLEGRLPGCRVRRVRSLKEIASGALGENQVVFAVGNVANGGRELMAWVREEGTPFV